MGWRRLMCGAAVLALAHVCPELAVGAVPLSDAGPVLDQLSKQLADRSQPLTVRLQIIKTIGDWQSAEVRPPLIVALKDPQPAVREAAAQALGWKGNDEAVPALRAHIESPDEAPAVKAAAVASLGRIGDRSARPLVVRLTRDGDASIRAAAISGLALGALVDASDQTTYLIQLAEERAADPQLRTEAIRVLMTKGKEDRIVASLLNLLRSEPRPSIALPSSRPNDEQIMALRFAQARDVPAWSAGALGQLDARVALPLLLAAAEDPNDYFLRMMALEALVAWKAPEAFPVLVRRLDDPLLEVRLIALAGLARLGDPRGIDPVLPHLSDENPTMRAQSVMALGQLGGPKVRPQLEALNQKELDPEVRRALETVLTRLPH
jgi:HEAT repeat protein